MKTIWKYQLELKAHQEISLPIRAKILCAQLQYGTPTLWCEVDSNAEKENRQIIMVGTGDFVPASTIGYIGTVQLVSNGLVFHFYENLKYEPTKRLKEALEGLMSIVRIHSNETGNNFAWAEMEEAESALSAIQTIDKSVS